MSRMTTIKVKTSTRDGVRALAERQGVTIDVAIRRMTALAERESRFTALKVMPNSAITLATAPAKMATAIM